MIATGIDGLSRGNRDTGVSLGFDIRKFIPLHLSAWEVAGNELEPWCKSWMESDFSPPLVSEDWFGMGHKSGVHIWPPIGGRVDSAEGIGLFSTQAPMEFHSCGHDTTTTVPRGVERTVQERS